MPNSRVHRVVGGATGVAYSAFRSSEGSAGDPLIESLGGWAGGQLGAQVPDLFEPAGWHHRRFAHSLTAGAGLSSAAEVVEHWAECARQRAARHRRLAQDARLDTATQLAHSLAAIVWSALAGLLNGLLAGYLSHLALDACTPACIPVA